MTLRHRLLYSLGALAVLVAGYVAMAGLDRIGAAIGGSL